MNNILFNAVDKNLESYAVPMFMSFKKFNPDIPMYCVVADDVSMPVRHLLKHLGVHLLEHKLYLATEIGHIILRIPDYIPKFNKAICIDIDVLVLSNILELFDYPEDLVGPPGFNTDPNIDNWVMTSPDGSPYLSSAIAMKFEASCKLRDLYIKYGTLSKYDARFIRKHIDNFTIHQLDAGTYAFRSMLIKKAEYRHGVLSYVHKGIRYIPATAHFNRCPGGRPRSTEIDKWCLDNGIQIRCDCQK